MPTAAPGHAGPASPAMVADQLDALLGEQVMPLRVRSGTADEPHLLAVDASGNPVVVEIVAVLDEAAVVRALRYAGRAARMSARDLADAYAGGAERFASHLAAFRLTVPATSLLSTFVRGGSRLLLVCSHVAPGVVDVLDFLLQPGWQVDVLLAQVVTDAEGRRVVELSSVGRPVPPSRDVGPTGPRAPLASRPATSRAGGTPAVVPPPFAVALSAADLRAGVGPATPAPVAAPEPDLVTVAAALGEPAPLVRCVGGDCQEALLHPDGFVELPDGTRHAGIDAATRALGWSPEGTDTWSAWRVDSASGPTLAEVADAVLGPQPQP